MSIRSTITRKRPMVSGGARGACGSGAFGRFLVLEQRLVVGWKAWKPAGLAGAVVGPTEVRK